jgi:hypothetical protein
MSGPSGARGDTPEARSARSSEARDDRNTMSCPEPERLAAAAAGEDRDAAEHALRCPTCRAQFDEQRQMRRLLGVLSGPPPIASERERLAAGLLARLDAPAGRRPLARLALGAGLAAAAVALVLWGVGARGHSVAREHGAPPRDPTSPGSSAPTTAAALDPRTPDAAPSAHPLDAGSPVEPQAPAATPRNRPAIAAAKLSGGAQFGRATRSGRDVIDLHDGELTVDTRQTAPAEIQLGTTAIRVANAKVTVTVRTGVLETVAVFAGSVELSSGARSTVVTAGTVWEAPAEPPTSDPAASLDAFREGWAALQQKRLAKAIAAFDRASDPVVHEDAAYWAAVATYRAGDRADARRRFTEFLARFPKSPRANAARSALETEPL